MQRANGDDLRLAAQRALAFGHAALDSPTMTRVADARERVLGVLSSVDERACRGEVAELVKRLRSMANELIVLERRSA
jgi:hypothetical protein